VIVVVASTDERGVEDGNLLPCRDVVVRVVVRNEDDRCAMVRSERHPLCT
jgi:hypothetical protein